MTEVNAAKDSIGDLEIVQKALERTGLTLMVTGSDWVLNDFNRNTAKVFHGAGTQLLLTWAKQQLGE